MDSLKACRGYERRVNNIRFNCVLHCIGTNALLNCKGNNEDSSNGMNVDSKKPLPKFEA
jgi:hypothetical protein